MHIGYNDCPKAGLDKLRAYIKGKIGFILATNCSLDDIREMLQRIGVGKEQELDKSAMSMC